MNINRSSRFACVIGLLATTLLVFPATTSAQQDDENTKRTYRNTTPIPAGITTPNHVDSSLGSLDFFDGVPTRETADKVYDYLDRARGVDAFLKGIPGASLQGLRKEPEGLGLTKNGQVLIMDRLLDSKALFLTANTSTLYLMPHLDTEADGPVVDVPPGMLGAFNDAWFRYVGDVGLAGPDHGKGGKYLVLPPSYNGEIPEGSSRMTMAPTTSTSHRPLPPDAKTTGCKRSPAKAGSSSCESTGHLIPGSTNPGDRAKSNSLN